MKKLWIVLVGIIAGFALFSKSAIAMSCHGEGNIVSSAKKQAKKTVPAVAYACPMHPEVTGMKPGKCEKCGMKLEKIKAKHIGN